ncbi:hypothetical protein ACHAWO_013184 [Cyclotella atomus]|uniref:Nitrogen permease regulator 3 n=1 Tax=Cyclotella atomus TaxID=382360 RepID=A0ABD3N980_9STRA
MGNGENDPSDRMGVLGIALVMEEVGKGARLVFRYPASPPPYFLSCKGKRTRAAKTTKVNSTENRRESHTQQKDDPNSNNTGSNGSIDLFFDLPARVISKLFRPKRPLCGQPLTLNVSGTTFCCRAELFDSIQSTPSTVGGEGNEHQLVLFSVIVALAPLASSTKAAGVSTESSVKSVDIDSAFNTIGRIHRNLARLCNALSREERRCQYVTLQCQMLLAVRKDYEDRLLSSLNNNESSKPNSKSDESASNNTRRVSSTPAPSSGGSQLKSTEKRTILQTPSGSTNDLKVTLDIYSSSGNEGEKSMSTSERREYIQQLIELMFATSPPDSNHGNLARELAEVFHFLSRHDDPTTPVGASAFVSRATGRDVYINQHVAVPFDSMGTTPLQLEQKLSSTKFINPEDLDQTLLFPNISTSEILRALSDETSNLSISVGSTSITDISASVSMSHAIRRMLTQLHPRKNLKEIASDSALSIHQVIQAANWLIQSGMSVAALPVTRKSRYVCAEGVVDKMRQYTLPFWQAFSSKAKHCQFHFDGIGGKKSIVTGSPHIFMIVSALTTNAVAPLDKENKATHTAAAPLLGDVIDSLCGEASDFQREAETPLNRFERPHSLGTVGSSTQREEQSSEDAVIYSMTVWLAAKGVICPVKE